MRTANSADYKHKQANQNILLSILYYYIRQFTVLPPRSKQTSLLVSWSGCSGSVRFSLVSSWTVTFKSMAIDANGDEVLWTEGELNVGL